MFIQQGKSKKNLPIKQLNQRFIFKRRKNGNCAKAGENVHDRFALMNVAFEQEDYRANEKLELV